MKFLPAITLVCLIYCSATLADTPQKTPLYSTLWTNSPFTSKPPEDGPISQPNPLDNFILIGVAPVPGGHRITMTDKKDLKKRIVLEPGTESKFKVVKVNRNPGVPLSTTVTLFDGNIEGDIRFEPKLVTLNAPAQTPDKSSLPPGLSPQQAGQNTDQQNAPQRPPAPRITPSGNISKKNRSISYPDRSNSNR
jgi:hypothetical protein